MFKNRCRIFWNDSRDIALHFVYGVLLMYKETCRCILIPASLLFALYFSSTLYKGSGNAATVSPVAFSEIWGYLMRGEEKLLKGEEPVTDIFYFSCDVNSRGRINMNVSVPVIPLLHGKRRRVHIVISELNNPGLMHTALDPDKGVRDYLIDDILELGKRFDGIQIDFEAVAGRDTVFFHRFLELINMGLEKGKIFSVALPPRIKKIKRDPYDYTVISKIADRVYIMAYDQHWSTGRPGPVASLSWCRNIVRYAVKVIPGEKLVMGIPLYGRAWYNRRESCAISASHIYPLLTKKSVVRRASAEEGVKLTYRDSSDVIVYYDDIKATRAKLLLYRKYVNAVGFWRIGMENRGVWREIGVIK
ncbi:MAG TPA: glycosyl hydrolase family 18 protein [Spirochaetota bacterium]|nr:glycosyl hydrolase family 18 protein [Spirochaetota bacterium]